MRCVACDLALSDKECTRKMPTLPTFADLCDTCWEEAFPFMNDYDTKFDDTDKDIDDVQFYGRFKSEET